MFAEEIFCVLPFFLVFAIVPFECGGIGDINVNDESVRQSFFILPAHGECEFD